MEQNESLKKIVIGQKDVFVAFSEMLKDTSCEKLLEKNFKKNLSKGGLQAVDEYIKDLYDCFNENNVNHPKLSIVEDYVNKHQI